MKDEVAVLGSPSLIVLTVSVDVSKKKKKEEGRLTTDLRLTIFHLTHRQTPCFVPLLTANLRLRTEELQHALSQTWMLAFWCCRSLGYLCRVNRKLFTSSTIRTRRPSAPRANRGRLVWLLIFSRLQGVFTPRN